MTSKFLSLSLFLFTASAMAAPAPGCPGIVHDSQVNLTHVTNEAVAGRATQVDVENARIGLIESRFACEFIPRGEFCREKDWSLLTIERIAEKALDGSPGAQQTLDAAQARLAAHRADCGAPPAGE